MNLRRPKRPMPPMGGMMMGQGMPVRPQPGLQRGGLQQAMKRRLAQRR